MSAEQTLVSTMTVKEHKKQLNVLAKEFLASEKAQKTAEEKSKMDALRQKKLEEDKTKLELEKQQAEEAKKKHELIEGLLKEKMKFTVLDDAQWVQVAIPSSKEFAIENSYSILNNAQDSTSNTNNTDNTMPMLLSWNSMQSALSAASTTALTLASSVATSAGAVLRKRTIFNGNFNE